MTDGLQLDMPGKVRAQWFDNYCVLHIVAEREHKDGEIMRWLATCECGWRCEVLAEFCDAMFEGCIRHVARCELGMTFDFHEICVGARSAAGVDAAPSHFKPFLLEIDGGFRLDPFGPGVCFHGDGCLWNELHRQMKKCVWRPHTWVARASRQYVANKRGHLVYGRGAPPHLPPSARVGTKNPYNLARTTDAGTWSGGLWHQ